MKTLLPLLFLFPFLLTAQLTLVTDLNPGAEDGFDCFSFCIEQPVAELGSRIVTVARSPEAGMELMVVEDGTFSLVKDIQPGTADASINYLRKHEGRAYLAARDAANGGAVWVSDGTEEGTTVFFDPDETSSGGTVNGFEFGTDGALYVVLDDRLFRFLDGAATELAQDVALSTPNDNFPGGTITPYGTGVAFVSNEDDLFGGGLFLATDTLRQLARIENQSRFDQAFGLRSAGGNLLFSLQSNQDSREGTYVYENTADTLRRYFNDAEEPLFVSRWYTMTDSFALGKIDDDYYAFDGLNEPTLFFDGNGFIIPARVLAPSLRTDSLFFLQTDGGNFNTTRLIVTDGTAEGTSTVAEGNIGAVSNLVAAGGYVFFATEVDSRGPIPFYRYELATGELTELFEAPVRADNFPYSVQLLGVLDGQLYLSASADGDIGRELYRADPGVDIVSVFTRPQPAALTVNLTAETFTVVTDRPGQATLSVLDLSGRFLENRRVAVNTPQPIGSFTGLRLYVFEHDGKRAVRRVVGR